MEEDFVERTKANGLVCTTTNKTYYVNILVALKQDHRRKDKKLKQIVGVKEHLHRLLSR